MNELLGKIITDNVWSGIIVVVYLIVIKLLDKNKDDHNLRLSKDLSLLITNMKPLIDRVIAGDDEKCKISIRNGFNGYALSLIEFCNNTIINNNIQVNRENILSNLDNLINSKHYQLFIDLSVYTINGNKVNSYMKDSWKEELKRDISSIMFDRELELKNKIQTLSTRIILRGKTYETYITNKTFQ